MASPPVARRSLLREAYLDQACAGPGAAASGLCAGAGSSSSSSSRYALLSSAAPCGSAVSWETCSVADSALPDRCYYEDHFDHGHCMADADYVLKVGGRVGAVYGRFGAAEEGACMLGSL